MRRLVIVLFVGMVPFLCGRSVSADGSVAVKELRCEYRVNPLGIDVVRPRFSWVLESQQRGRMQSAYRIMVAGSEEKLSSKQPDLWDTGKVNSDQSAQVVYAGEPLRSRMRCYWTVRVWDNEDRPSAWSRPAMWSMGLLNQSDWNAQWIGAPREDKHKIDLKNPTIPPSPLLRRSFTVDVELRRAMVYVTALGEYELRINGEKVGDHILAPEWTDYHQRIQYQSYDVTKLLRQGANVIAATLADGWYAGRLGPSEWDPNYPRRGVYGLNRRVLLQLELEKADGLLQQVVTDSQWKINTDGPIRSADHFLGEIYDVRKEQPGWDRPGADVSNWQPVTVDRSITTKLVSQMNEPIRIVKILKPVALTEPEPGVYIFDLGQNMVGFCRVRLSGRAGTTVTLRHGEMLDEDGTLYTKNLKAAISTDKYILNGSKIREFQPHFTFHGFRYVEVTGLEKKPTLNTLVGCVIASDAPPAGEFECSNPMLNQLWKNILWSQRGNMHGIPTDCPNRAERLGWLGDIQAFAQTAVFNMDMAAFLTKWFQDLRDAQCADGSFPDFVPFPPLERLPNAPGWADAGVIVPWCVYQNYGDKRVLQQHFESAKRFIDHVHKQNPDLVWKNSTGRRYGDWLNGDSLIASNYPKEGGAVPHDVFATAFFAYSTQTLSRMAEVLGRRNDARYYANLAEQIRAVFNDNFVDKDGRIEGNTQAGYALALNFDLLDKPLRPIAAGHMVEAVNRYDGRISTGFSSTIRLMLELTRWGYNDLAYQLIESRRFPSWCYTIDQGATTIWERWDGYVAGRGFQNPGMNSFNHYALGSVGEWMYRTILGINLDVSQPAMKHVVIRPRPGGSLTWAKGEYNCIHGRIVSGWKIKDGRLSLNVTIPANTTATVYMPAGRPEHVTESGKPAEKAECVKFLRMQDGTAVYQAASGAYSFAAETIKR